MARSLRAFTLIELLTVLALIAVLFAAYLSLGPQTLDSNKVAIVEKEIINTIQYARTIALAGGKDVALNALLGTEDWSMGTLVFIDNKTHHFTSKNKLLSQWQWHGKPLEVKWYGFRAKDYLVLSANLQRAAANGHFVILYRGKEVGRIVLNRLGRIIDHSHIGQK